MSRRTSKTFMDELMAEPIPLAGCPSIIVTRDFAYRYLKDCGYPLHGGFGSVDYMVFRHKPSDEPLTPLTADVLAFLARVQEQIG